MLSTGDTLRFAYPRWAAEGHQTLAIALNFAAWRIAAQGLLFW
jgi:hypothetical protein